MPNKLMLAALAASLAATPASATQGMRCADADGAAEVSLLLGTAGGLGAVAASMASGAKRWTTDSAHGEGDPFTIGQGFADRGRMDVDFFDAFVNEKVAELRLVRGEEADAIVLSGFLRIIGHGVWPVVCDEE